MRTIPLSLFFIALLAVPVVAQTRVAAKEDPTFPEAVEIAQKAFEDESYGQAVTALQAAIRAVQQLQRVAILAALPQPEGFTIEDEVPDETAGNPFAAGLAALGMSITRHYRADGVNVDVEVMANSPLVQMMSMMFSNPALIAADGGELVQYDKHKAILKESDEGEVELTILLHDKHVVKVRARGLSGDELLKMFDQATVDRLEKPLGE